MKTSTSRSFSTALTTGVLGLVMALGLTSVGIGAASAASGHHVRPIGRRQVRRRQDHQHRHGQASEGGKVTGSFTPTRFVERDGVLYAKGFLQGKITDATARPRSSPGSRRCR